MNKQPVVLSIRQHDRNVAGLTYVYPVVSRRAGGVSIGINLNPNNACNWRCVYCQVPDLQRGAAPEIDLALLERELRDFVDYVLNGDFMLAQVPPEARRLNDIALSGNGEPTSAACFEQVVQLVGRVMSDFGLIGQIKLVLITNGSLMSRLSVQRGLEAMQTLGGEVWFKIDRGSAVDMAAINQINLSPDRVRRHLKLAAERCSTWVQTCMFCMDGEPPDEKMLSSYLALLQSAVEENGVQLKGVLLYGLARSSMQPEAARLSPCPVEWMAVLADRIERLGLSVRLSV
ncbi:radical SAM protein [Chitinivorax sp. B]|uniref:radical SAM protein n=1 Tax=Chitinivorax sp. B TaxID=2502235 RepID=UPI0010F60694|nr:radical SAM protein [Chitinivorax sp. B]